MRSIALAACALFGSPALAQVTGPLTQSGSTEEVRPSGKAIRAEVTLALVNVTATDPYGRLVTGLEKENFHVFEDGMEQEIVSFSSEDVPVSIGLIFDMSGSMSDKLAKARQAAVQFLQTANPRDEFFLVSFGDRAELARSFTSNIEELQNGMLFTSARGRTALFDAIYLGLSQMRDARNSKRALLIISDGGDNSELCEGGRLPVVLHRLVRCQRSGTNLGGTLRSNTSLRNHTAYRRTRLPGDESE